MRRLNYTVVDVFTETALDGNPLAVFTNGSGLEEARMQAIARELSLSEIVFLLPAEQGGTARVRIFTPRMELPFAGHPLIGTAYVLPRPLGPARRDPPPSARSGRSRSRSSATAGSSRAAR